MLSVVMWDDNHCQCSIDATADDTSSDEDDDHVRKQGGTTIDK